MRIEEVLVETPTTSRLKAKPKAEYGFSLREGEIRRFRDKGLPPSALLAFAAIKGAIKASGEEWAALSHRTLDIFDFPTVWWRLNVRRLEDAGFIECDRQPGKLRRYRLVKHD